MPLLALDSSKPLLYLDVDHLWAHDFCQLVLTCDVIIKFQEVICAVTLDYLG